MVFFRALRVQPRRRPYNRTMPALRRHRLFTVLLALCSLLFMQLAVAGYSCPGVAPRAQEVEAMPKAVMPCAESMALALATDDAQPNLCQAHCQSAQTAGDNPAPQVPVATVDHGALITSPVSVALPMRSAPQASLLARATAPPLAIRNCCLRI